MPHRAQPVVLITTGAFLAVLLIAAWGWIRAEATLRAELGQPTLAAQIDAALPP